MYRSRTDGEGVLVSPPGPKSTPRPNRTYGRSRSVRPETGELILKEFPPLVVKVRDGPTRIVY